MTRGSGGSKFHVWRWVGARWVRQTRAVIYGDVAPELYKFTEGQALELRCAEGAGPGDAGVRRRWIGGGAARASAALELLPAGVLRDGGGGHVRGRRGEVRPAERAGQRAVRGGVRRRRSRRCRSRGCATRGRRGACGGCGCRRRRRRSWLLAAHTSVVKAGRERAAERDVPAAPARRTGGRRRRCRAESRAGTVDAMVVAADGALWLVTERLLRRGPDGAWTSVALPETLRGPAARVDLRGGRDAGRRGVVAGRGGPRRRVDVVGVPHGGAGGGAGPRYGPTVVNRGERGLFGTLWRDVSRRRG
jgi:hypothetical protein